MPDHPQCRFGDGPAIARFRLDAGCLCFPDDREQDLCWHHAMRATPFGSFELIADYTLPGDNGNNPHGRGPRSRDESRSWVEPSGSRTEEVAPPAERFSPL